MAQAIATIDIYFQGQWHTAATLTSSEAERGYSGSSELEYAIEYAAHFIGQQVGNAARLSCRYPVDFQLHEKSTWPAFMLDILPNGFGREHWLKHLDLNDNAHADWPLLLNGTAFPPGNMRIHEAVANRDSQLQVPSEQGENVPLPKHPGFTLNAVLSRQEHFIEYAVQNGAYTSGASDVQGAAPKFMLTKDAHDRWHAEGALADEQVASHWLVKFARGRKTAADRKVLKNEAAYMVVARRLGLNVFDALLWAEDTLLIPRFDRIAVAGKPLERLAMESLCALTGTCGYGVAIPQEDLCQALATCATNPQKEIGEFVKRDIANVVLGNKDNHARNSAVFRLESGEVTLTPLFDFAPMYLDPEGISRMCRWQGDAEIAGTPQWKNVLIRLSEFIDVTALRAELLSFGRQIEQLETFMREAGVDDDIIEQRRMAIKEHSRQLLAL
ncbi:MAG: HipA domain-containing protein [Sedimenticola sp.]